MREMYPDDNQNQQQNPYEFIMSPPPAKRRGLQVPGVKNPFLARMVLIVLAVAVVVIIIGVILANVFGKSGVNIPALIGVAQTQQELIRVSQQGATNGTQQVTRIFATNVELSLETEQIQLLNYLKTQGSKPSTKILSLKRNTSTDTQLTTAQQTSTFDSSFVQIMQNSLVAYNTELEQVAATATGTNEKKLLANDLTAANVLLQQVPSQESIQNGS